MRQECLVGARSCVKEFVLYPETQGDCYKSVKQIGLLTFFPN